MSFQNNPAIATQIELSHSGTGLPNYFLAQGTMGLLLTFGVLVVSWPNFGLAHRLCRFIIFASNQKCGEYWLLSFYWMYIASKIIDFIFMRNRVLISS